MKSLVEEILHEFTGSWKNVFFWVVFLIALFSAAFILALLIS